MGEWGKFDRARQALIATLRIQPESARFQVVVYSGTALVPVHGAPGQCLPATPANLARTIAALEALSAPTGRSNHLEGLRSAVAFHSDLVLFFTDDDLPRTAFRGITKSLERTVSICMAKVGTDTIESPMEVK